jgi:hypothetical protein
MADIFISYRRSDGRWSVRAIHQQLEREVGPPRVFLDTETIEAGDAFADLIRSKVAEGRTLLAVRQDVGDLSEFGERAAAGSVSQCA